MGIAEGGLNCIGKHFSSVKMEGMTALVKMGRWIFHWAIRKGGENFNSRLAGSMWTWSESGFCAVPLRRGEGGGQDTAGRPGSTNTLFVWRFSYTPLVEVTAARKGADGGRNQPRRIPCFIWGATLVGCAVIVRRTVHSSSRVWRVLRVG